MDVSESICAEARDRLERWLVRVIEEATNTGLVGSPTVCVARLHESQLATEWLSSDDAGDPTPDAAALCQRLTPMFQTNAIPIAIAMHGMIAYTIDGEAGGNCCLVSSNHLHQRPATCRRDWSPDGPIGQWKHDVRSGVHNSIARWLGHVLAASAGVGNLHSIASPMPTFGSVGQ